MFDVKIAELKQTAIDITKTNVAALNEAMAKPELATALGIRLTQLTAKAMQGVIDDGHCTLVSHAAAINGILARGTLSSLTINDSTPEGYAELQDIKNGPDDPYVVRVYNRAHFVQHSTETGEMKDCKLYVYSSALMAALDARYDYHSCLWVARAAVVADGTALLCPMLMLRGIEPEYEEITLDQAILDLGVPATNAKNLRDCAANLVAAKNAPIAETLQQIDPSPAVPEMPELEIDIPEIPEVKLKADDADFVMDIADQLIETHTSFTDEEMKLLACGEYLREKVVVGDLEVERCFSKHDTVLVFKSAELTHRLQKFVEGLSDAQRIGIFSKMDISAFQHLNTEYVDDGNVRNIFIPNLQNDPKSNEYTFTISCTAIKNPHALLDTKRTYERTLTMAAVIINTIKGLAHAN